MGFHGQPLHRTYQMPSKTSRLFTHGRPRFFVLGSLGKRFFSNLHNLPGIRYLLFDFVLSLNMET